jgi:hypothetical protein
LRAAARTPRRSPEVAARGCLEHKGKFLHSGRPEGCRSPVRPLRPPPLYTQKEPQIENERAIQVKNLITSHVTLARQMQFNFAPDLNCPLGFLLYTRVIDCDAAERVLAPDGG